MGGLDPWGHYYLRDLLEGISAKREMIDLQNTQLLALLGNALSQNPQRLDSLMLGGKNG